MRSIIFGVCLALAVPASARSQAVSLADCASAATYVSGRPLPDANDTTLAWYALSACDSTGEAAAVHALQTATVVSETDSTRIQLFMVMFSQRRIAAFFNAWQALILNPQASDFFKRAAIGAYGNLYRPGVGFGRASTAALNAASCGLTLTGSASPDGPITNLPGNALAQMVATMSSAASNASNSDATRGLANCWSLLLQTFQPAVSSKISALYVCGNTFKITNTNAVQVVIKADVIPPTALQKIEHHANTIPAGGGAWTLPAQMRGNLRVTFNGTVIQTVVNHGTSCP